MRRGVVVQGGLRAHVPDDGQDRLRPRRRRRDLGLDLVKEDLAVVRAADEVVRGGDDAIRGGLQVVRDDDLLPAPTRLVQRAELAEVVFGLAKAPVLVEARPVEFRQRHSACVVRVHLEQQRLHGGALRIPEGCEGVRDASGHAVHILEGVLLRECVVPGPRGILGERSGRGRLTPVVQGAGVPVRPGDKLRPMRDRRGQQGPIPQEHVDGGLVVAHHPVDHVRFQQQLDALAVQGLLRRAALLFVDLL
mmetsp:Transcript_118083/g.231851  ORF Transcript_118083/g.231851 Transcript_118083/m.231851 type:complete len:249 (-) Transcript_118083:110-856(-)